MLVPEYPFENTEHGRVVINNQYVQPAFFFLHIYSPENQDIDGILLTLSGIMVLYSCNLAAKA